MRLNLAFYLAINIHMGSSVRLTGLGTVAGEKWKFLARWVDFQKILCPIMAREKDDLLNFRPLATSSLARPLRALKKLASLGKKLMRSTSGKSTRWDVCSFSGVFK